MQEKLIKHTKEAFQSAFQSEPESFFWLPEELILSVNTLITAMVSFFQPPSTSIFVLP
ncbi:hypothetical protein [Chryseobacterium sp. 3008163]|uniref:hypothetical protein n=1 Tax=Chryseobacterium sp. 3008163 TaxID=2478663 RepID=UPI001E45BAF2|nr:hypothetical protein [Chryseobacterium sp. 3008163]